jgi:hypothetical protein
MPRCFRADTLYYFPTKEHLVFDQHQEFEARILAVVLTKPTGVLISEVLQQEAERFLQELTRNIGRAKAISHSVTVGPDLRRVWIEMNARMQTHWRKHYYGPARRMIARLQNSLRGLWLRSLL